MATALAWWVAAPSSSAPAVSSLRTSARVSPQPSLSDNQWRSRCRRDQATFLCRSNTSKNRSHVQGSSEDQPIAGRSNSAGVALLLDPPMLKEGELEVYVAKCNLDPPLHLLPPPFEHWFTVVGTSTEGYTAYDFRPKAEFVPFIALRVLTFQPVLGEMRCKKLKRLPRRALRVGTTTTATGHALAERFQQQWTPEVNARNNCRHHTNALVEQLTGKPQVLEEMDLQTTYQGILKAVVAYMHALR
eukprot:jgi/Chlat1/4967/Chrsp32S04926